MNYLCHSCNEYRVLPDDNGERSDTICQDCREKADDWWELPGLYDEDDNPLFTPQEREAIKQYVQAHPNWQEEERLAREESE